MRTLTKRSLAVATGALALAGGALVVPNLASAQTAATFTVSPTTASEGDTVLFTATGCELEGVEEPAVSIELLDNVFAYDLNVIQGTAAYAWDIPAPDQFEPGTYQFSATCYDKADPEGGPGFVYDDVASLTINTAPASTTTTAAPTPSTAKPAVAAAAVTQPAFTG